MCEMSDSACESGEERRRVGAHPVLDQVQGLSQSVLFVLLVFIVGFLVELSEIIDNLPTHNTHLNTQYTP